MALVSGADNCNVPGQGGYHEKRLVGDSVHVLDLNHESPAEQYRQYGIQDMIRRLYDTQSISVGRNMDKP